jgi:hypothetical protein
MRRRFARTRNEIVEAYADADSIIRDVEAEMRRAIAPANIR